MAIDVQNLAVAELVADGRVGQNVSDCCIGLLLIEEVVNHLLSIGLIAATAGVTLWLWATIVFANLAEAIAEGRGKAQADTLRATRTQTSTSAGSGASRDNVPERLLNTPA